MASVDYRPAKLRIQAPSEGLFHKVLSSPLSTLVAMFLIIAITSFNAADLSVGKVKVGLDAQVILKLIGIALPEFMDSLGS